MGTETKKSFVESNGIVMEINLLENDSLIFQSCRYKFLLWLA